mmetsp:Transcript_37998/g.70682  ORF Transcript_37998/g.70682 Transcript_37998/m.70682 type:complete len:237 (-) Transcript_37998:129-839(-)
MVRHSLAGQGLPAPPPPPMHPPMASPGLQQTHPAQQVMASSSQAVSGAAASPARALISVPAPYNIGAPVSVPASLPQSQEVEPVVQPLDSLVLTKIMWSRTAPAAVSTLIHLFSVAQVPQDQMTCRVCSSAPMGDLESHLLSDDHLQNLALTAQDVPPERRENPSGRHGPRVQEFPGQRGKVWFNHLTLEAESDCEENRHWTMWDYGCRGCYWYNEASQQYFQVFGRHGLDCGPWR